MVLERERRRDKITMITLEVKSNTISMTTPFKSAQKKAQ